MKYALVLLLALSGSLTACGGQTVEPLDPRDLSLPPETRQWIALAEDGVLAARARRDAARDDLAEAEAFRDRMEDDVEFNGAGNPTEALEALLEARVELASFELDAADAWLDLAEAKYILANAERAMLHDLAQYDLVPLRADVDAKEARLRTLRASAREKREVVDRASTAWWTAFGGYVSGGGETRTYWLGQSSMLEAQAAAPRPADAGTAAAPAAPAAASDAGTPDAAAAPAPANPFD